MGAGKTAEVDFEKRDGGEQDDGREKRQREERQEKLLFLKKLIDYIIAVGGTKDYEPG